jgi:hypothetical protein
MDMGEGEQRHISVAADNTPISVGKSPLRLEATPSRSLSIPVQKDHARLSTGRIAAIDLRIGLKMLGEQGRKLLAEYIVTKRQERGTPNEH